MAKRKRLTPANPAVFGAAPETKGIMTPQVARAPIADVASEAAATAALDEVTRELAEAREGGRMVLTLPLDDIRLDHLVRDRITADDAEMAALVTSLAERGQQTPIEVMALDGGGYGLISGWRRSQALAKLTAEGRHDGTVLALLRKPAEASDAYLAMVEENEIRVGLSYFERARIAAKSVDQGVFETEKAALLSLFRSASRAKRSKIRSFLPLVKTLDGTLSFPHQIGERLGLRIAAQIEARPRFAKRLSRRLAEVKPETAEAELAFLTQFVTQAEKATDSPSEGGIETESAPKPPALLRQKIRTGLNAEWRDESDSLTLSGADMTPELRARLFDWLKRQR